MPDIDLLFAGPLGPLVIFLLRIVDVSLSTVRILLAVRGRKLLVPIIGFVEVLIWLLAAGSAIRHLDSVWHVLGYSVGFAAGTSVGLWLEEKLAIGIATMQIITLRTGAALADGLRALGCGVTAYTGQGRNGPVEIVHTVVARRQIRPVLREVERWDPDAFITIEEPREIRRGWMFSTPRLRSPAILRVGEWARRAGARKLPK